MILANLNHWKKKCFLFDKQGILVSFRLWFAGHVTSCKLWIPACRDNQGEENRDYTLFFVVVFFLRSCLFAAWLCFQVVLQTRPTREPYWNSIGLENNIYEEMGPLWTSPFQSDLCSCDCICVCVWAYILACSSTEQ